MKGVEKPSGDTLEILNEILGIALKSIFFFCAHMIEEAIAS